MSSLEVSEVQLNQDSFTPYVEITFKTRVAMDKSMFATYNENVRNLMVAEYEMILESQLREKLLAAGPLWLERYL
jgi:hypothetical protein